MELIKLTGQEIAADRLGITFTLKDIADKFKIRHNELMKQFETDLNSLSEKQIRSIRFSKTTYQVAVGNNATRTHDTYELGVKEVLWVISRFKADLRLKIIDYAFKKLEEDHSKAIKTLDKDYKKFNRVNTELANKMFEEEVVDESTYMSVSKFKRLYEVPLTVTELYDILEEACDIETESVVTKKRKLISDNGVTDVAGNPRFTPSYLLALIAADDS